MVQAAISLYQNCLPFVGTTKDHSFSKQCLHDLQFMKTRSSSPNIYKLARADISSQFMKKRSFCRHCLQNKWTLRNVTEKRLSDIQNSIAGPVLLLLLFQLLVKLALWTSKDSLYLPSELFC